MVTSVTGKYVSVMLTSFVVRDTFGTSEIRPNTQVGFLISSLSPLIRVASVLHLLCRMKIGCALGFLLPFTHRSYGEVLWLSDTLQETAAIYQPSLSLQ